MLKYLGVAMLGLFAVMVFPMSSSSVTSDANALMVFGMGSMTVYDEEGQEQFAQTIHNRIVNQGEEYLLDQVFDVGATVEGDSSSIGSICLSADASFTSNLVEGLTAASFDTNDGLTTENCLNDPDQTVVVTTDNGLAQVGSITFGAGSDNWSGTADDEVPADTTIYGIGICQTNSTVTTANWNSCADGGDAAGSGILFAGFDITDVTLADNETVQVTYTFNVTSNDT